MESSLHSLGKASVNVAVSAAQMELSSKILDETCRPTQYILYTPFTPLGLHPTTDLQTQVIAAESLSRLSVEIDV
jgi:hypothetical protein